jgi:hypothetical protein
VDTLDQSVRWPDPPDPSSAFRLVARACIEDGWKEVASGSREMVFEKEGAERTLYLNEDPREAPVLLRERRLASR